jgi:hypothetical protein
MTRIVLLFFIAALAWAQPQPTGPCTAGATWPCSVITNSSGVTKIPVPLAAASGGVGANINVPAWLRFLGDGSDGAIDCSTNITGVKYLTTFNVSVGNTCTSNAINAPTIIYATGSCTIAGRLNARGVDSGVGAVGDSGGSGGGGGGGTAAGTAGSTSQYSTMLYTALTAGGTVGGAGGGAAGNGGSPGTSQQRTLWTTPHGILLGGAKGGAGGSSGGAAGPGGQALVLVCASINFTGTIDVSGQTGTAAAANTQGGGGGGGGGYVWLIGRDSVVNTGAIAVQGGPGGNCYAPAIVLSTPASGLAAGVTSGTGAIAHISTFAGGNPTVVTVDAAGSGYSYTPACAVVGGTGTGATCAVTMAGVSPNQTVSSIAVSGGNAGYGTGATYTTCGVGGYGGLGWAKVAQMQ